MTEQDLDKLAIMAKLRAARVWDQAEAYREAVRRRCKSEGQGRAEAVNQAWKAMCDLFLPIAEQVKPAFQTILPDGAESYDDIVDPDYAETDNALQMRDLYRWIKEEFHRVVVDHSAGAIVDFRLAKTPPPTGLACKVLETWASKPPGKRDHLYEKIQKHAASFKEATEPEPQYEEEGGFLHLIQ